MKKINTLRGVAVFVSVFLFVAPANANAIIPLAVFIGGPLMISALIPVILVEGFILIRYGVGPGTSYLAVSAANLLSTIAGIPIAIVLAGVFPVDRKVLHEGISNWRDYFGILKICAACVGAFFLVSCVIESWVAGWFVGSLTNRELDQAIYVGNVVTYGLLSLLIVSRFTYDARLLLRRNKIIGKVLAFIERKRHQGKDIYWNNRRNSVVAKARVLGPKKVEIPERQHGPASPSSAPPSPHCEEADEVLYGTVVSYRTPVKSPFPDTGTLEEEEKKAS